MPASWSASLCSCMVLYRTSHPLPKISVMPQRKHCLGSATPQRNIVFLISPTRAHACLISCSGRKKIPQPLLPTYQQPISLCACSACCSSLLQKSQEDVDTRARSKLPRNAWHRVDLCVPLSPLRREDMEIIRYCNSQQSAHAVGLSVELVRQTPALLFFEFESVTSKRHRGGRPSSSRPHQPYTSPSRFLEGFRNFLWFSFLSWVR
jgi:hypothetical protein